MRKCENKNVIQPLNREGRSKFAAVGRLRNCVLPAIVLISMTYSLRCYMTVS